MPSAQPVMYRALLTMFARKKRVPIDPPNSGPRVRLIMTEVVKLSKYEGSSVPPTNLHTSQHFIRLEYNSCSSQ